MSQSHSSGAFIHSCLPAAGLPGCPAALRCWLQGICGQHGPGVPGQAGTGAEAAGCGGVLVRGGRAAWCQAAMGACGSDAGDPMAWQCQAALLQRISEIGGPLREHHSSSAQSAPISGISILGGRGRASHAWSPPSLSSASLSARCDNGRPALHLATVLPGMKSSKSVAGNTFYKPKVSVDTRGRFQLSPTFVRKERDQGCLRE